MARYIHIYINIYRKIVGWKYMAMEMVHLWLIGLWVTFFPSLYFPVLSLAVR